MPLATCKAEKVKVDRARQDIARLQNQRNDIELRQANRRLNDALNAMAAPMSILIDLLPENQTVTLSVKPGQFVSIPYKGTTRKGEILVVSNFFVRYRVDAVSANLQMASADFQAKWGREIFEYVEGSLRDQYLGATPGKASATGRQVIARYLLRTEAGVVQVQWRPNTWHPLLDCDMSHSPVDAVDYWNSIGRHTGPRSAQVRAWMLNPNNYIMEPASINRSRGSANNSRYQPPTA
jgi:hypothetical protein